MQSNHFDFYHYYLCLRNDRALCDASLALGGGKLYNSLGYKALKTFQQAEQIYELTKVFCQNYLDQVQDRRLSDHMVSSGRSIKQNIAEGHGRGNTKANLEFLGFSLGSLTELLEDYFDLEKDFKEGLRKTRKNKEEALKEISKIIKLLMGEKTMLERQIEGLRKRFIQRGDEKEDLRRERQQEQKRQIVNNYNRKYWS